MKLDPENVPEDRKKIAEIMMKAGEVAITAAQVLERGIHTRIDPEGARIKYAPKPKPVEESTEE
jgi:hypothetical protein